MNTNTQAQTEQAPPALKPSFHHRLCYTNITDYAEATPGGLSLAVEMIVTRANAVLAMVRGEFTGEEGRGRTSDHILYYSLESVGKDLEDLEELVHYYTDMEIDKGKNKDEQA